ncbi:hypothetical protein EIB71_10175 [Kaistella daneshvariae]|uniref:Uncharacterized protein n=1 Tax=Kaistella daneshvariae TaxID=2487074 RepID=A0ABM7CAI1_9FLAO|nr:hypothetical protein [Kaistella daneshvariae]AZI68009.1 hypothetical protein EIB71_10175 [Kaistella daneshvariae]
MKNSLHFVLIFLLLLFVLRCNDRNERAYVDSAGAVQIDSVKIERDTMQLFSIQAIQTFSTFNSSCEGFYGYDYIYADEFHRDVTSYKFTTEAACGDKKAHFSQINFRPQQRGTYFFKFFNGYNSAGKPIWIEKKITVQ